jgi:hypothetical protein
MRVRIAICLFIFYLFVAWLIVTVKAADYSAVLTDLRNKPIPDEADCSQTVPREQCPQLTLGSAAANALLMNDPDLDKLSPIEKLKEKVRRERLAERVIAGGKFDLGSDDISLIKRKISDLYGTLVVGKASPLLDPAEVSK